MLKLRRATVIDAGLPDGPEQQLAVDEAGAGEGRSGRPVAVLALHRQLAPVVWAFARAAPGRRLGYVQAGGGALPAGRAGSVGMLRGRGLLAGQLTAGSPFGGEAQVSTTVGALDHGLGALGWDAAVCGPGPSAVGRDSSLEHDSLRALDGAHAALALGCPALLVALMSADPTQRRHGISAHTLTVLDLLLAPVTVALPAGVRSPVGAELRAGLGAVFGGASSSRHAPELQVERPARVTRHDWRRAAVDLPGYAGSGLAGDATDREVLEDPLLFATALAAGVVLAQLVGSTDDSAHSSIDDPARSVAHGFARS